MRKPTVLLALAILAGSTASAQAIVATQQAGAVARSRAVTLDLKGVTLRTALDEISRQSGEVIGISADAYGARTKVDVRVRGVSAYDAVRAAIQGTNFKIQTTDAGRRIGRKRICYKCE